MKRNCPVCKNEYDDGGDSWKNKCYDCWLNYRSSKRIKELRYKENVYISHPSVSAEEVDKFIVDNKLSKGWGVKEIDVENYGKRFRIWFDDTNFD